MAVALAVGRLEDPRDSLYPLSAINHAASLLETSLEALLAAIVPDISEDARTAINKFAQRRETDKRLGAFGLAPYGTGPCFLYDSAAVGWDRTGVVTWPREPVTSYGYTAPGAQLVSATGDGQLIGVWGEAVWQGNEPMRAHNREAHLPLDEEAARVVQDHCRSVPTSEILASRTQLLGKLRQALEALAAQLGMRIISVDITQIALVKADTPPSS